MLAREGGKGKAKMLTEHMDQHYQAVLRDLEQRRAHIQEQLAELDQAIAVVRKTVPSSASVRPDGAPQPLHVASSGKYMGMSMRWAILNLLAEDASAPMPTSEVAAALQAGGISSSGKSFISNVSAVLSVMANTRKEIESAEGGYRITEHGREVWKGVKGTEQYQNRLVSSGH